MNQFFESIRVVNGRVMNLFWHQKRINKTVEKFGLSPVDLDKYLYLVQIPDRGVFKFRLSYGNDGIDFQLSPYNLKPIKTLKIVHDNNIDYTFKRENRKALQSLFNKKKTCDDILIIKDNLVTDTSFGNIIFQKDDQWFTPTSYLLNGTMRQRLLAREMIVEREITVDSIQEYDSFKIINAMRPPSNVDESRVDNILP